MCARERKQKLARISCFDVRAAVAGRRGFLVRCADEATATAAAAAAAAKAVLAGVAAVVAASAASSPTRSPTRPPTPRHVAKRNRRLDARDFSRRRCRGGGDEQSHVLAALRAVGGRRRHDCSADDRTLYVAVLFLLKRANFKPILKLTNIISLNLQDFKVKIPIQFVCRL